MNCNHPQVVQFILDCLRYWVLEMHIDGFRFDLASIMTRAPSVWIESPPSGGGAAQAPPQGGVEAEKSTSPGAEACVDSNASPLLGFSLS